MNIKNEKGQMVVEAVLIIVVLLGLGSMVTKALKQYEIGRKLTSEPWTLLSGMIVCGTWQPCRGNARGLHPSTRDRALTTRSSERVK